MCPGWAGDRIDAGKQPCKLITAMFSFAAFAAIAGNPTIDTCFR